MCDGIDGSTNATVCDEKPLDIDSAYATKSENSIKGVDESGDPSSGPHPRKDEPIPSAKQTCCKCGADLTGHGIVTKGGKTYCALPGCGYPERGKSEAPA